MDELIEKAFDTARGGQRVLWASDSWARAWFVADAFREMADRDPGIVMVTRSTSNMRVDFGSGGQIRFVSATSHACRGLTADLLCLDGVTDERALACLLPCAARGEIVSVSYV